MAENITNVRLLKGVPFSNDYKHTLYFMNTSEQQTYFEEKYTFKEFSNFSYQQKDSKLRVNLSFDEAQKYNYVMYQNTNYNSKWFYAFITGYEWKSTDITELTIETDVLQTWLRERKVEKSFIEREHTRDDTIGLNTIPENLEMGEYIVNRSENLAPFTTVRIVLGVTMSPTKEMYKGARYHGCYSGIKYYSFSFDDTGISQLHSILLGYDIGGVNDSVVCMFLAPSELSMVDENSIPVGAVTTSNTPYNKLFNFTKSDFEKFSGYIPKNKKLFTYPYNYLLVSNNNGGSAIYQFEHFKEDIISLAVYGVLTPGCSIRMIPMNYKGSLLNDEEGLNLGKYPICNWTSDEYTNWLTQNSVNIGLNLASGLGQIVAGSAIAVSSGGLATAVGGSSIVGGVTTITNQLAQIHQMSFTPPQANGNINSGDVITAIGKNTFTLYQMCCKPEYMRIIDEFFSTYGYKSHRVDTPFVDHREYWWYTKLVDANITSNIGESIPVTDLNKIKECYNNGVTFWSKRGKILDYSQNNTIR